MQSIPAWARRPHVLISLGLIALGTIVAVLLLVSPLATTQKPASAPDLIEDAGAEFDVQTDADQQLATPAPVPTIVVHVSGAVQAPDVYSLSGDARIKDLIIAAGGLSDDADPERINLAERLKDGQHVVVPRQGEETDAAANPDASQGAIDDGLININTASVEELDTIEGVGTTIAERIVAYRSTKGPFKSIDDLKQITGIGTTTFAKIAPHVTVGP